MYCSHCGKEISDDSKFCYSCGSKFDFVKSSENSEKVSISPIDTEIYTKHPDAKEKSPIIDNNQTDLTPPLKTKHDIMKGYGWGWFWLLSFYGVYIRGFFQIYPDYNGKIYPIIIIFLGLLVILPIYFWFRRFLIKKNFWKGHIGSSSCLSGIISYILVVPLVIFLIILIGGYEKRKEINQFPKGHFVEPIETGTEEGWVSFFASDEQNVFYNKNSVTKVDPNTVRVWVKTIHPKFIIDTIIKDRKKDNLDGYDKFSFSMSLLEIDCKGKTNKVLQVEEYNTEGKVLFGTTVPFPETKHIVPSSMGEELFTIVCSK